MAVRRALKSVAVVLCLLCAGGGALAQAVDAPAPTRIAPPVAPQATLSEGVSEAADRPVPGQRRAPVLTVDPNRLFAETLFGQQILSDLEAEAEALSANNRELEAMLRAEERALTAQRPSMTPEDFRDTAEAFDQKVQAIRRERTERARALDSQRATAEARFLATAQGALVALMEERGASVLLDMRSVILRDNAIDITSDAVKKIDAAIGRGEGLIPQD